MHMFRNVFTLFTLSTVSFLFGFCHNSAYHNEVLHNDSIVMYCYPFARNIILMLHKSNYIFYCLFFIFNKFHKGGVCVPGLKLDDLFFVLKIIKI